MAKSVVVAVQQALQALDAERKRIHVQIDALQRVLTVMDGR